MEAAINSEVTANIAKAELFSMPVLLILLLVIFGSLAAAALPVAIGGVAILGSFTVLRLLTMATTVSVYSVNITTILGLGLGLDYGLFMVTRFREELHRQPTVEQAVARTVATAARTPGRCPPPPRSGRFRRRWTASSRSTPPPRSRRSSQGHERPPSSPPTSTASTPSPA
jgi:hypothetical protein